MNIYDNINNRNEKKYKFLIFILFIIMIMVVLSYLIYDKNNNHNLNNNASSSINDNSGTNNDSSINDNNGTNDDSSINNSSGTNNDSSINNSSGTNNDSSINDNSGTNNDSSINDNNGTSDNNSTVNNNQKQPTDGIIKSSTKTSYGITYLEGIYPTNIVSTSYDGACELQVKETTSSISRYVYYYKWNYDNGEYEKISTKTNGIKYINNSKVDGKIYMQWYLTIDGEKYYTPIYERNCSATNSEIVLSSNYISDIDLKYSNSDTPIDPNDSILITTANYQVTLREFKNNNNVANSILGDIKNKYILSAPHSVKQWRNNNFKVADVKTGVICEILAKLTNSVCISRTQFDKTDPNVDSFSDSDFQQLVVNLINQKNIRILVDIHGITNGKGYDYAIGTRYGVTLYSGDKCTLEKKFATAINDYAPGTVVSLNQNSNYNCGFDDINNVKTTASYTGGALIANTKSNTSISKFSSIQIEISNYYRTSTDTMAKTINSIYKFLKN